MCKKSLNSQLKKLLSTHYYLYKSFPFSALRFPFFIIFVL